MNRFHIQQFGDDIIFTAFTDKIKVFRCPKCQACVVGFDVNQFDSCPDTIPLRYGCMLVFGYQALPWPDGTTECPHCGWRGPSRDVVAAETLVPEARDVGDTDGAS